MNRKYAVPDNRAMTGNRAAPDNRAMTRNRAGAAHYRQFTEHPAWQTAQCWTNPIKTVAFTGHRPEKLPWGYDESSPAALLYKFRLRETLEYLIGRGYVNFLSGGARGFDMMAAEMVLSLRETYPWIQLVMVLPCANQADRWSAADRQRWEHIIQQSDHVETLTAAFDKGCMFRRNRYLVEHSDLVLAAYDGRGEGGTAMTVDYAHRQGRKVRRLAFEPRCECH